MTNRPITAILNEISKDVYEISDRCLWTPVTESLPEADGEYLVTVETDTGKRQRKVSSFTTNGVCYSWGIETSPMYTVKAWCELPEMWEG